MHISIPGSLRIVPADRTGHTSMDLQFEDLQFFSIYAKHPTPFRGF